MVQTTACGWVLACKRCELADAFGRGTQLVSTGIAHFRNHGLDDAPGTAGNELQWHRNFATAVGWPRRSGPAAEAIPVDNLRWKRRELADALRQCFQLVAARRQICQPRELAGALQQCRPVLAKGYAILSLGQHPRLY